MQNANFEIEAQFTPIDHEIAAELQIILSQSRSLIMHDFLIDRVIRTQHELLN